MWQLVTSVLKNERAITVWLESLDSNVKVEKVTDQFTATDLNADDGMKTLLNKLQCFSKWSINEAFNVSSKFINLLYAENVDTNEYILEYKHLYKKMEDFGMKLPDAVFVFKLLDGANLSVDDWKLALAFGKDMKFSDMKSALKQLFNKASSTDTPNIAIKDEEAYYSKLKSWNSV